jgi:hypothetical protein
LPPPTFDDKANSGTGSRGEIEERYIKNYQTHVENMIRRALDSFETAPRLSHVPFTIIRNGKCNAYAFQGSGEYRYRIVVYDGLIFGLLKNFCSACMHPEMKSWLPEGVSPLHCVPLLESTARQFLILHELAHIVNGHLDIYSTANSGFVIAEAASDSHIVISAMDSQAFEINADSTAAVIAFESAIRVHLEARNPVPSEGVKRVEQIDVFYRNCELAIRLYFFAVAQLFILLGPRIDDPEKLETLSHPPAFLRMAFIAQQADLWLDRKHPGLIQSSLLELSADAYGKAENCLSEGQKGFSSPSDVLWLSDPRVL